MLLNATENPRPKRQGRQDQGPALVQIAHAAVLGYDDELRDEEIARELGIARRTLARWKLRPEYQAAYSAVSQWGMLSLDREHHSGPYGPSLRELYASVRAVHGVEVERPAT
jgi:hypothetical protein